MTEDNSFKEIVEQVEDLFKRQDWLIEKIQELKTQRDITQNQLYSLRHSLKMMAKKKRDKQTIFDLLNQGGK